MHLKIESIHRSNSNLWNNFFIYNTINCIIIKFAFVNFLNSVNKNLWTQQQQRQGSIESSPKIVKNILDFRFGGHLSTLFRGNAFPPVFLARRCHRDAACNFHATLQTSWELAVFAQAAKLAMKFVSRTRREVYARFGKLKSSLWRQGLERDNYVTGTTCRRITWWRLTNGWESASRIPLGVEFRSNRTAWNDDFHAARDIISSNVAIFSPTGWRVRSSGILNLHVIGFLFMRNVKMKDLPHKN